VKTEAREGTLGRRNVNAIVAGRDHWQERNARCELHGLLIKKRMEDQEIRVQLECQSIARTQYGHNGIKAEALGSCGQWPQT
jgi:hypothetical protein